MEDLHGFNSGTHLRCAILTGADTGKETRPIGAHTHTHARTQTKTVSHTAHSVYE